MFDAYLDAGRIGLAGNSLRHFKKKCVSSPQSTKKEKKNCFVMIFFSLIRIEKQLLPKYIETLH